MTPRDRDRLLGRARLATRLVGVAAAGATALLSVVAAQAFRGHDGVHARAARTTAAVTRSHLRVAPPEHVPAIAGAPPPLQPPPSPPEPAPAAPAAPAPVTSGGS